MGMKSDIRTYCGDCLDILNTVPEHSVDLAILDPPYFRIMVKDYAGQRYDWDDQWNTLDDYTDWMGEVFAEVKRVLKPNGSIYCF